MKYLLLLTLAVSLLGCAHGSQAPENFDEAQETIQDEADPQLTDVQDQASEKTSVVVDEVKDKAATRVGNAAMSKAISAALLRRMSLIGDAKTLIYANTVGQFIAQELVPSLKCHTDGTSWSDVRVGILKSSVPSSFSLPGGKIFVTTSLVQKMESEDEFAGVIANEMVSSICGKGVPANLAEQASSGWSDYILGLPTKALSRADLMFADRYALVTLYRRGYDVMPYVTFISKNETIGRHMYGIERAAVLEKSVAATPPITPTQSARMARWNAAKAKAI